MGAASALTPIEARARLVSISFNSREKYKRKAENGTRWTKAAAPHNTTVVSTQNDFNMDQMTLDLCFAIVMSECFY